MAPEADDTPEPEADQSRAAAGGGQAAARHGAAPQYFYWREAAQGAGSNPLPYPKPAAVRCPSDR